MTLFDPPPKNDISAAFESPSLLSINVNPVCPSGSSSFVTVSEQAAGSITSPLSHSGWEQRLREAPPRLRTAQGVMLPSYHLVLLRDARDHRFPEQPIPDSLRDRARDILRWVQCIPSPLNLVRHGSRTSYASRTRQPGLARTDRATRQSCGPRSPYPRDIAPFSAVAEETAAAYADLAVICLLEPKRACSTRSMSRRQ